MQIGNFIAIGNSSSSQGEQNFASFSLSGDNPVVSPGLDVNVRNQSFFEIDDDTWGMCYMVGDYAAGQRLGIKYATAPKSDPHNWTKVDEFLIESDSGSWDVGIDGMDIIRLSDGSWVAVYGDYDSGKVGIATLAAGTFGAFTKSASNPVIDNTANSGAWNQYLRHPSIILKNGTYYIFSEAREGANDGANVTDRAITKATSTDLVNWTQDDEALLHPSMFSDNWLYYQNFWMPNVALVNNTYIMVMLAHTSNDGGRMNGNGFILARSTDLETWTMLNTQRCFLPLTGRSGGWDDYERQEPSLFVESGNVHLYFNARSSAADGFDIGYATLTRGAFDNDLAPLFSDDFESAALDDTKWDDSPQGGITLSQSGGELQIAADGSSQALVEVLAGLTGLMSNDVVVFSFAFVYKRDTISGGDCEVGISNADNSNRAVICKGSTLNHITIKVVIGGVAVFTQEVLYNRGKLKIQKAGGAVSFWESNGTSWTNITPETSSEFYYLAATWANELVYPKVLAANGTTAYNVYIDDAVIHQFNSPLHSEYVLSDSYTDADLAKSRMVALTAQEKTAIETFVASCIAHGNWDQWDEVWCYKLNADDALTGFKQKVSIPTSATHSEGEGYAFDGTDDWIFTRLHLRTDAIKYAASKDRGMISVYIHTFGPTTSGNRTLFDASATDGVLMRSSCLSNGTNRVFRLNTDNTTGRTVAGLFSSDELINVIRSGSAAGNNNMYTDGALETATNGAISNGIPNDILEIGRITSNSAFFNGKLGLVAVGKHDDEFDQDAWNTDVRQFLSDLD